MKAERYFAKEATIKKGIDILVMESVKRHRAWQRMVDKERFFDEVFGG